MSPGNRELFAHLAVAVANHVNDLQRKARSQGQSLPPDLAGSLESVLHLLTDCARTRPDATSGADAPGAVEPWDMTDGLLLTKRQAAAELACSVRQLERVVAQGGLRTVRVEGAVRIRRSDIEQYVADLAPGSGSFLDNARTKDAG